MEPARDAGRRPRCRGRRGSSPRAPSRHASLRQTRTTRRGCPSPCGTRCRRMCMRFRRAAACRPRTCTRRLRLLCEELDDAFVDSGIVQRRVALLAEEDRDGHAPDALARDAPVGTRRDHVGDALLAPRRVPLDLLDSRRARAGGRWSVCRRRLVSSVSILMNHCSVARTTMGLWQRQQCG